MHYTNLHTLIFICSISTLLRSAIAQLELPPIACPQYFRYVSDGFTYFGLITLPQVALGRAEVRAHFCQRGLPTSAFHSRITPYPDESTVVQNVFNHQPATFRVDFDNPSNPPKLTLLSLDGSDLCLSSDYPPPNSWSKLSYQLYTYYSGGNSITIPNGPNPLRPVDLDPRPNYPTTTHYQPDPTYPPFRPGNFFPNPSVSNKFNTPTTRPTTRPTEVIRKPTANTNTTVASGDSAGICGKEGTAVRGFVYGGFEVSRGQFPWLTAIYNKVADGLSFKCGGSLISRRTVISAAHCFKRLAADQIVLFFGRYNLQSYSEDSIVTREVEQLIIHTDYVNGQPNADLALLQIEALEKFSEYIKPICLWSELDESPPVGKTASVVGWGYESEDEIDISPLPKIVDVKVVSKGDCLSSSEALQTLVTDKTICAGNRDGTGPCMGDSGGALMLNRNNRWVLRGVVSVGQSSHRHCNLFEYVVYCDVARHMTWIRQNLLD